MALYERSLKGQDLHNSLVHEGQHNTLSHLFLLKHVGSPVILCPNLTFNNDTPEKYNGWHDWTTWNVALWINNDQTFYSIAKECKNYADFLYEMQAMIGSFATPDGADWGEANIDELNEVMQEIN